MARRHLPNSGMVYDVRYVAGAFKFRKNGGAETTAATVAGVIGYDLDVEPDGTLVIIYQTVANLSTLRSSNGGVTWA